MTLQTTTIITIVWGANDASRTPVRQRTETSYYFSRSGVARSLIGTVRTSSMSSAPNPRFKTTRPAEMMLKSTLWSFRGDNLGATPFAQAAREA
ncbi:uncharacterized protein MEPE_03241 [Melanopsichium pennsylvanicum]|uniref:Uncharacterized protein n=1 Tax=Melanopsichium pennsylvanicum TaxID=63383 RepID=A0AAJ4XLK3_9BASI|nr:uncharacterized protein MEPE_03241 [Melanopsichium pennsylvanicum]